MLADVSADHALRVARDGVDLTIELAAECPVGAGDQALAPVRKHARKILRQRERLGGSESQQAAVGQVHVRHPGDVVKRTRDAGIALGRSALRRNEGDGTGRGSRPGVRRVRRWAPCRRRCLQQLPGVVAPIRVPHRRLGPRKQAFEQGLARDVFGTGIDRGRRKAQGKTDISDGQAAPRNEIEYLKRMRLTRDGSSGSHLIRGYAPGELRIDDERVQSTVLLSATVMQAEPTIQSLADLSPALSERVLAMEPELVLLGTGPRQHFPEAAFGARFLRANVGFEVMDTGAACRTFNVLVAEQRRVVAVLML